MHPDVMQALPYVFCLRCCLQSPEAFRSTLVFAMRAVNLGQPAGRLAFSTRQLSSMQTECVLCPPEDWPHHGLKLFIV